MAKRGSRSERFLPLLEGCRDQLARFAVRMLGDEHEAQDAVQETVMIAFRKFERFDGGNFRGWMFAILTREIFRARRTIARRVEEVLRDPGLLVDLEGLDGIEAYDDVRRDPDRVLQDLADPLHRAIRDLPEAQRIVLLLRVIEGFRYREIAEMLDVPIGTVMTQLHRARWTLRERLGTAARARGEGGA